MQTLTLDSLNCREMCSADICAVLKIERNAQVVPWSRLSFEESLTKSHLCRVLEYDDEVVAFSVICPILEEMHILNLAIATHCKGLGLGHVLMHNIVQSSFDCGSHKLFLEVRESNKIARSLYHKWQFRQISVRKGYYRTPDKLREDALVLVRELARPDLVQASL